MEQVLNRAMNQAMKWSITACAVVWMAMLIGGCAGVAQSVEQLATIRDQAAEIQSDLRGQLDELSLMRESIPDGSAQHGAIDALMAQISAKLAIVDAAVIHTDQVIEGVSNPSDPLTIGAQAISPWIPAPIQAPLVLGAALLATLIRSRSLSTGARSIVESISHAMNKDESFKIAFASNADTIRTIQSPTARRLVDKWSK